MWTMNQNNGNAVVQATRESKDTGTVLVEWEAGVDAALVRGVTDTDRTAVKLRRSDGTAVYLYVDTGTTLVVSTTAP